MRKIILRYWTNVLLGITFLLVGLTGIFKFPLFARFFSPVYTIISPSLMKLIHAWSGIIMVLLVGIHLFLNRPWIVSTTKSIFTKNG